MKTIPKTLSEDSQPFESIKGAVLAAQETYDAAKSELESVRGKKAELRGQLETLWIAVDVFDEANVQQQILSGLTKTRQIELLEPIAEAAESRRDAAASDLRFACERQSKQLVPTLARLVAGLKDSIRSRMVEIFSGEDDEQISFRVNSTPRVQTAESFLHQVSRGLFRVSDVLAICEMLEQGEEPFNFQILPMSGPPPQVVSFAQAAA